MPLMIDAAGRGIRVGPRRERRRDGTGLRVLRGDARAAVAGLCRLLNRGEIPRGYKLPRVSQQDLATLFGVDQATISRMIAQADASIANFRAHQGQEDDDE